MLAGSKKDTSYDDTGYKDTICHATSYEDNIALQPLRKARPELNIKSV